VPTAGYRRQLYRDDAVVLRVQKLGESDRIITLLTRRHGRVRAVARGVRRTTSRFGALLEPFGHIDVQLAGSPRASAALCTR
jgi:DNA repair protein RecO (recombination protein O)